MERSLLEEFKRKCLLLRIMLNSTKECQGPVVVFQGVIVDLEKQYFRISTAMRQKIQSFSPLNAEAGVDRIYDVAEVEKLVGRFEWCSWLVAAGRQHLFYLLKDLQAARDCHSLDMSLSSEAEAELNWWRRDVVLSKGKSFAECDHSYLLKVVSE